MRGSVASVEAAMEAALKAAEPIAKIVSHTIIASPIPEAEDTIHSVLFKS